MLLYVASEFGSGATDDPPVVVFQSRLFEAVLPPETHRFEVEGTGRIEWVDAVEGETADPGNRAASLARMRRNMLDLTKPSAAIFVGGMDGISDEWSLVSELLPECRKYAFAGPGGEARRYAGDSPSEIAPQLKILELYPFLADLIVKDIVAAT